MTFDEAVLMAETKWWEDATDVEIVKFQLYENRLCMPFGIFHETLEKVLDRPIQTFEFAKPEMLKKEFEYKHPEEVNDTT